MSANKFTRADIAKRIMDAGVERTNATAIARAIVQAMADALTTGKVIELWGLGTLEQRTRKAHTMHNPCTMTVVDVPDWLTWKEREETEQEANHRFSMGKLIPLGALACNEKRRL